MAGADDERPLIEAAQKDPRRSLKGPKARSSSFSIERWKH